jgi:predicted transcriptional regulator
MARTETLSRREREMMNIIFRMEKATAGEVREAMADPPGYSAVRATLRVLERKGHLRHEHQGARYVYVPRQNRDKARKSALEQVLTTFFDGSAATVVATLLEQSKDKLSAEDLDRLSALIDKAREEGR